MSIIKSKKHGNMQMKDNIKDADCIHGFKKDKVVKKKRKKNVKTVRFVDTNN